MSWPASVLLSLVTTGEAPDYQRDVRPILSDRCFACHGPDAAARKAGLRLDVRTADVLAVDGAELLRRVTSSDPDERMPPADGHEAALTTDEVDVLAAWIADGAPYTEHWSYRPVSRVEAPAGDPGSEIDAFLAAGWRDAGVEPAPEADARTLLRRLSFDLTGLPPSAEEVAAFVANPDEEAYRAAVESLLASPAHAERMAQFWLDLVRYGDSSGYHSDRPIPVWPYRDWVIEAFGENLAFDDFTRWQIAGDLYEDATETMRVASIYNRLNKTTDEGGAQAGEYVVKYAADRVRTTASAWLGTTMGCAECHDHKYDPLPQRDFYRLAAFFADIEEVGVYELNAYRQFQPHMQVDGVTTLATVAREPRMVRVLPRGNWLDETGEVVEPGTPDCWPPLESERERADRRDLAEWLVRDDNPLVARVMVNRLWYQLFGEGLSSVLDDLGRQGEYPSHPELLDWLARRFIESGWDVRDLVRTMVTSRAYRQDATPRPELAELDPENRLVARQARWRLDAEFVRDTSLRVAGLLDARIGGPSVKPYQPAGYWQHLNFPGRRWEPSQGEDQYRRGLYTHWQRTFVHPALLALDAPTREECAARRPRSNHPLAALVLLDDPSYVEAARVFAEQLLEGEGDRIRTAFERTLQREPTPAERTLVEKLLEDERARFTADPDAARQLVAVGQRPVPEGDLVERATWTQVCRTLLNLHETFTRP